MPATVWLRAETKPFERRVPIIPEHAKRLLGRGARVVVESFPQRCIPDEAYAEAGCEMAETGSWRDAPADAFILGLKDLPEEPAALRHRHVYFGHVYKGQRGAEKTLRRFADGGGSLVDLEYLTDENGRRLTAFGYWAGYVGAALGVRLMIHMLTQPDVPFPAVEPFEDREAAAAWAAETMPLFSIMPTVIVIGALGRTGTGACNLLERVGLPVTKWDLEETRAGGPFFEILEHSLFMNCVLMTEPTSPFVTLEMLRGERSLVVIADIACDPNSPLNPLPIYDAPTTVADPAVRLDVGDPPLAITAIDHLPALLPHESSADFSRQLIPLLETLVDSDAADPVSARALAHFERAIARLG